MGSSIREKVMPEKDADTRVRRIARRIVSDVNLEDMPHDVDLKDALYKVQSEAISLSVSTSELIGLMKRQNPEFAAEIDAMENPPGEDADGPGESEKDEAESGESGGPESEDEKD